MIKTIIVENEKKQSDIFTALLSKHFPEVDVLKICNTVADGVREVNDLKPQLIFLDVELDHSYTGFDLLEQTRSINYEVIFTTSYNKYASRAFRFCALDFIEKPFGVEELTEALNRYKTLAATGSKKNIDALLHNVKYINNAPMQKAGIPVLKGIDFISVSEIIYCKAVNTCTDFYLTGKRKITATKTLKWVNELLDKHNFFRSHDSYFVNLDHIVNYRKESFKNRKEGQDGEGGTIELSEQMEAPVSRRKKEELLKILFNRK